LLNDRDLLDKFTYEVTKKNFVTLEHCILIKQYSFVYLINNIALIYLINNIALIFLINNIALIYSINNIAGMFIY